jgi:ATP-binding cassette subfamily B protein
MTIDVPLTFVALGFVPLVGYGASIVRLKLRVLWYAMQEELEMLTRIMEENLSGIRVVRAFASQAFELARFDFVSKRALAIVHRRIAIFVAGATTMTFAFFATMALVLWVGGQKVAAGAITLGDLASFLAFMALLQQPVRLIAWMVNSIARTSTCGARLFDVLDLEPEIRDRPGARPLEIAHGIVRFERVSWHPAGAPRHRLRSASRQGRRDRRAAGER